MTLSQEKPSERSDLALMLAYLCIKEVEGLSERVSILDRFRFSDANIALVCGVAEQSVRNARQKNKASHTKKKEKGR